MKQMLRRLRIQIVADKRRFGMLCAALAVGLLLWARLIIVSRVPRTAVAEEKAVASTAGSQPKANSQQPTAPKEGSRTMVAVALSEAPARDPFVISPVHFPKPTPVEKSDGVVQKSSLQPTEEPDQVEARRTTELSSLASVLRLEAAFGESMAVVNGKRLRPGDGISLKDGSGQVVFRLETIKQRSVILECEGRRYELQMAAPGD